MPDDRTYKIIRFNELEPAEVILTGLTLDEAQAHCRRDDTHGPGWFDGYEEEDDPGWPGRSLTGGFER